MSNYKSGKDDLRNFEDFLVAKVQVDYMESKPFISGLSKQWAVFVIKFHWNTTVPVCLWIAYGCLLNKTADGSSFYRDRVA